MKQGDRKYEDRIFGHKKTAQARIGEFWAQKNRLKPASRNFGHKKTGTGRHRGILDTKKTGTGRHRGIMGTKKPAEAGCMDGAPQWTRTTDPHHVKVML